MPVIKPALHHVTFKTSRLDEMMAWYGTRFNCDARH
jgi:catechol 2,3-dioxygenase